MAGSAIILWQVVEYQYKPEYLARFSTGEREKMEKRQTGVIAQVTSRPPVTSLHQS
jgi:hypothetical protein